MGPEIQGRVDRTRQYVLASSLPEEAKDGLVNILDLAESAANGHPDKIQAMSEVLLAWVLHGVKRDVREPDRLSVAAKAAVAEHVTACPLRTGTSLPKWAAWAFPFRWQIMVVLSAVAFAPRAPDLIRAVAAAFGVGR